MISVVIPALNAEATLAATLSALVPAAMEGLVRDVVVSDGGSTDATRLIAEEAGCAIVVGPRGRGGQIARGIDTAKADWVLVLHADTVLSRGWERDVALFVAAEQGNPETPRAAAFKFALRERGWRPRILERLVSWRCALFALPYGDQGLLISRRLLREIGGYSDMPLMEDVDIIRRIGRRRLATLQTAAETSAERYRRDGYIVRAARNLTCLTLYYLRVPPHVIGRIYG